MHIDWKAFGERVEKVAHPEMVSLVGDFLTKGHVRKGEATRAGLELLAGLARIGVRRLESKAGNPEPES